MGDISHLKPLIGALASEAAADYLRVQTAARESSTAQSTKPVPLPDAVKAA